MRPTARLLWFVLAAGCLGLVAGSLVLTALMDLHPCSLCIFQRLLFMAIGLFALLAAWLAPRRTALAPGLLVLICTAGGIGIAAYQVWLQAQPPFTATCGGGILDQVDVLVVWLGDRVPVLFLATGLCEESGPPILGLSLAQWALIGFSASSVWALWAMITHTRGSAVARA
jgi:protein dithiol:quinone oxidoreductase